MNSNDDINVRIQGIKTTASEKLDTRVNTAINKSLAQAEQPDTWRIIMKSNMTKLAIGIMVIIIAAIAVFHFSGGDIDLANPAFADVMEQLYKAKNVTYKQRVITPTGGYTSTETATDTGFLITSEIGVDGFTDVDSDIIGLFDQKNGMRMAFSSTTKGVIIIPNVVIKKNPEKPHGWLDWIQKMHHEPAEYDHSEVLDGKNADVFLIEDACQITTIWVDPQTDLPVKIVMEHFPNTEVGVVIPSYSFNRGDFGGSPNGSASFTIGGSREFGSFSKGYTMTMTDFVWDAELDSSLLNFKPPDGWEFFKGEPQESGKTEKEVLIKALSFWTEMTGGKFPNEINDLMDPDLLDPLLIKKYNIGGDPYEQCGQAYKQVAIILRGLYFAQKKINNCSNWHYAGADVAFGDTDTPIAWWQNDDRYDNTWTIIYADLSFDETAEEPPL